MPTRAERRRQAREGARGPSGLLASSIAEEMRTHTFRRGELKRLLPEGAEPIATRYDSRTDCLHVALASGDVVQLKREDVMREAQREAPRIIDPETGEPFAPPAIDPEPMPLPPFTAPSVTSMRSWVGKTLAEHLTTRPVRVSSGRLSSGRRQEPAESAPTPASTAKLQRPHPRQELPPDEAWEIASARLDEWATARERSPLDVTCECGIPGTILAQHKCHASHTVPWDEAASVMLRLPGPSPNAFTVAPFCVSCAAAWTSRGAAHLDGSVE